MRCTDRRLMKESNRRRLTELILDARFFFRYLFIFFVPSIAGVAARVRRGPALPLPSFTVFFFFGFFTGFRIGALSGLLSVLN